MRTHQLFSSSGLIMLSLWCLAWEGYVAPLNPAGSWLILKSVPIILPLIGILRNTLGAYQYAVLLVFPYFIEGVVRSYAEFGSHQLMAVGELILSLLLFVFLLISVRSIRTQGQ
ncbi:MAG: DUF2069 domain-containing protein [Burkholderiales bacterium]|nr:MAG: hypothetical protein CBB82_06055 [Betaproteobacteria bacterium TMED22]